MGHHEQRTRAGLRFDRRNDDARGGTSWRDRETRSLPMKAVLCRAFGPPESLEIVEVDVDMKCVV